MQISAYFSALSTLYIIMILFSIFELMKIQIDDNWRVLLQKEFDKPYMQSLFTFLKEEHTQYRVYPPEISIFDAFNHTSFEDVKVVILGQDPYHQDGQANGLAFSVVKNTRIPPSLRNIYKELKQDIPNFEIPHHGDLSSWAKQGVFLLNTTLSVRENEAGSHQKKGWEEFTDKVIREISERKTGVVFMLWGKFAERKADLIDSDKHSIIVSSHPSPLSAYRGFLGSKVFSTCNDILEKQNIKPIDWKIPLV